MTMGTKIYFSSNCPWCSGVEEGSKCISSFLRGERQKEDGQKERTPWPWERERERNLSHIVFRNGWGRPYFSAFLCLTSLSCASPTTALRMCYDNWKWWAARARSGMNRSQGVWHTEVGERDFCWESCSLKIQPSSELPAGIHEELSVVIPTDVLNEVNKQLWLANGMV